MFGCLEKPPQMGLIIYLPVDSSFDFIIVFI